MFQNSSKNIYPSSTIHEEFYAEQELRYDAALLKAKERDNWVPLNSNSTVKWGSVTQVVPDRSRIWSELQNNIIPIKEDPSAHDVFVGRVLQINRHSSLELESGRRSSFFPGDIVGMAFGHRYATQQYFGDVPPRQYLYDMMSQGGVCGRVISSPSHFSDPTLIEPLGYLVDSNKRIVNLQDYSIPPMDSTPRIPIILVVGSSMDAGKTTMASSIIHGLTLAQKTVHAGKLTGTACMKDLNKMQDAGSAMVLDFSKAGFASTANSSEEQLRHICHTLISNLSKGNPDYLVLEIADGIIQPETQSVIDYLNNNSSIDHLCLAVGDVMSALPAIHLLKNKWRITPSAISGAATISPLSMHELRSMVSVPCYMKDELALPSVTELFAESTLAPNAM